MTTYFIIEWDLLDKRGVKVNGVEVFTSKTRRNDYISKSGFTVDHHTLKDLNQSDFTFYIEKWYKQTSTRFNTIYPVDFH